MGPQGLLLHSQAPVISPYPEPDQSTTCLPHSISWRFIFLYYFPSTCVSSVFLPSSLPTKTQYAPLLLPIHITRFTPPHSLTNQQ